MFETFRFQDRFMVISFEDVVGNEKIMKKKNVTQDNVT